MGKLFFYLLFGCSSIETVFVEPEYGSSGHCEKRPSNAPVASGTLLQIRDLSMQIRNLSVG
jgi:hypothetical protein